MGGEFRRGKMTTSEKFTVLSETSLDLGRTRAKDPLGGQRFSELGWPRSGVIELV